MPPASSPSPNENATRKKRTDPPLFFQGNSRQCSPIAKAGKKNAANEWITRTQTTLDERALPPERYQGMRSTLRRDSAIAAHTTMSAPTIDMIQPAPAKGPSSG
jgi:hypothetical protein